MSKVQLGRVTGSVDVPRGADVLHRIRVPSTWFDEGALIELELPRNLKCAQCKGGGCDRCERSGAISIRERDELGELVQVRLPKRVEQNLETTSSGRAIVIRIPERGGIADSPDLPRGTLLLSVVPHGVADPGVTRIEEAPEPEPVEIAAAERAKSLRPPQPAKRSRALIVVIVLLVSWILLLIWLRLTGRG